MADKKNETSTSTGRQLPKELDPEHYELDDGDGLPREIVGTWSVEHKHTLLRRYIDISGVGVRRNWLKKGNAGATYIDLFSGPGRVRNRTTNQVMDGSPLVAWRQAHATGSPFTAMYVADANAHLCGASATRLRAAGAPVQAEVGNASATVDRVIAKLNPYALHFAFLDPFKMGVLPFDVIRKLAALQRMDILVHISAHDFNRNLRRYIDKKESPIDCFAPRWRDHVGDLARPDHYVRARILEHWRNLLRTIGMDTAEVHELVTGDTGQPLYWLAFVARHPRALEFWEKIRDLKPDPQGALL